MFWMFFTTLLSSFFITKMLHTHFEILFSNHGSISGSRATEIFPVFDECPSLFSVTREKFFPLFSYIREDFFKRKTEVLKNHLSFFFSLADFGAEPGTRLPRV